MTLDTSEGPGPWRATGVGGRQGRVAQDQLLFLKDHSGCGQCRYAASKSHTPQNLRLLLH